MAEPVQHITCKEVVELVTDYLEGALPAGQVSLFEQHLLFCEGCMTYLEQIRVTVSSVGRLGTEDVPDVLRDRLLAVFRDWKRP
jgi:hypothetical protein